MTVMPIFNGGITAARCGSRAVISSIIPFAENSANNAINYNGNNGNLNNNNKNNTYSCRGLLELRKWRDQMESLPFPLSEFYDAYKKTRKNKGRKPSHLVFNLDYPRHLRNLCIEVNGGTYQPTTSIDFVILYPMIREIIAADFRDRVVQTLLVKEMLPFLEAFEHPHSYSCRVGKGVLKAVERLRYLSVKYYDGYVCIIDIKSHFMSIDTAFWVPRFVSFIGERYPAGERRDILQRLAEIIYYHRPQDNCVKVSPPHLFAIVPEGKSMSESKNGVAIGNVTSQTLSNFITTWMMMEIDRMGIEAVLYTDDTTMFSMSKEKLLDAVRHLREYLPAECRMTLHPKKLYIQKTRRGFNALGHRIRGRNDTPSKRQVHNLRVFTHHAMELAKKRRNLYGETQRIVHDKLNSYLSLMSWCHSFNIRKEIVMQFQSSPWNSVLRFPAGYHTVEVRKRTTRRHYLLVRNIRRRKEILKFINENDYKRTNFAA